MTYTMHALLRHSTTLKPTTMAPGVVEKCLDCCAVYLHVPGLPNPLFLDPDPPELSPEEEAELGAVEWAEGELEEWDNIYHGD